jgi:multidrug efflux pump subunit AcrA (membrane-fusion protein)
MTLPGPLKLTLLILLAVAAGSSLIACGRSNGQPNNAGSSTSPTPSAIDVSAAPVVLRQLPRFFEATGSLAPDQQTDVAAETSGKVIAVGVDMGSSVRRGQMIVKLDDVDSRLRVQQAQAQLDQALATLRQNEAKIGLRPGQKFNPENDRRGVTAGHNLKTLGSDDSDASSTDHY